MALLLLSMSMLALPAVTSRGGAAPQPWTKVTFLDVGQGDACFIASSEGAAVLVDGGPRHGNWDAGASIVVPFLHRQGVSSLDLVVLTHPHNDHLGGLETVISRVPTRYLVDSGQVAPTPEYARLLLAAERLGVAYLSPLAGDTIWDDGVLRLRVLHAGRRSMGDYPVVSGSMLNEGSLVIEGRTGPLAFLVLGDLGERGQSALVPAPWPAPHALTTAGHHGSRGAVSLSLIENLRPRWALVSASARNRWGFPHRETIDAYQAAGVRIWITGRQGSFTVESASGSIIYRAADGRMVDRIEAPGRELHLDGPPTP
jgi:competence protein ComEC